jgi:hypothetical protein
MKFFQETTVWGDKIANHVYLLTDDKSKMIAYVRAGTDAVFKFKNPIRIDTRGRSFKAVPNTYNYSIPEEVAPTVPQWIVKGSKGDEYIVRKNGVMYSCTCSGFKFRGSCKHVTSIQTEAKEVA